MVAASARTAITLALSPGQASDIIEGPNRWAGQLLYGDSLHCSNFVLTWAEVL